MPDKLQLLFVRRLLLPIAFCPVLPFFPASTQTDLAHDFLMVKMFPQSSHKLLHRPKATHGFTRKAFSSIIFLHFEALTFPFQPHHIVTLLAHVDRTNCFFCHNGCKLVTFGVARVQGSPRATDCTRDEAQLLHLFFVSLSEPLRF